VTDDENEMTPEQKASLAGQAKIRILNRMKSLDTSFMNRLGDDISESDQLRAMADMNTFLMNEVIALWQEIEMLRRRLGDEGPSR
jgi:hypothetical protein